MLSIRLLVNDRLLVVKVWGSQQSYAEFRLCRGPALLTPVLFKGRLYPQRYFQEIHGRLLEQQNSSLLFLVDSFRCYPSEVSQRTCKHQTGDGLRSKTWLLPPCAGWGVAEGGSQARLPTPSPPSAFPLPSPVIPEIMKAKERKKWLNLWNRSLPLTSSVSDVHLLNHACECVGQRTLPR